jgi:hypothetical protein
MPMEENADYSNNHMEIKYNVCGRILGIFNVKAGGIHKNSQHSELQGQSGQKNVLVAHEMFIPYLISMNKIT